MDRKESANGLQLIKFGAIKLKGHFSTLFMGTFAMCTPLILVLGVPMLLAMLLENIWIFTVGVLLFVLMAGPLQIGYIKFFNGTINGEQPRIRSIYSHFKFSVDTLKYIYFVGILFILYVLGFCLWIVPAGFAISFYSMVLFFQEKFEYTRFSAAFKDCSRKMLGNRLAMFSYKLIFYFIYFLLICVAGISLCLIYTLALDSVLIAYIVTICVMIIFIFLYTMITVYFHSCNQIFFEDTLMYHARKTEEREKEKAEKARKKMEEKEIDAQTTTQTIDVRVEDSSITDNPKKEEKIEDFKEGVVEKPAKNVSAKKTPAKTPAKGTTTPKKSTTTKKTTTAPKTNTTTKKSTTTKKTTTKTKKDA